MAVDSGGHAYLTGYTNSADYPVANALQSSISSGYHAFVSKLNPSGSAFVYSTFIAGNSTDTANSIVADASGNAWFTGVNDSSNFPGIAASSPQTTYGGGGDAFVAELNSAGSALTFATYLGGSSYDSGAGIALDPPGNVYVTGTTESANFPVTGGVVQTSLAGLANSFVAKLSSATGTLTPTQVVLTSSPNPSASGAMVTLSATVSVLGGGAGTPTGSVVFSDGSNPLGTVQLNDGQAQLSATSLQTGTHSNTATYSGDPSATARSHAQQDCDR